jgi:hypothetical protein
MLLDKVCLNQYKGYNGGGQVLDRNLRSFVTQLSPDQMLDRLVIGN